MKICRALALILLLYALTGCGLFFGPGFSMHDKSLFMEQPHIVLRDEGYALRWRYGEWGFYFYPESKVVNGELLFSLQATTSSGARTGRYGEVLISDPAKIRALEEGGAYWIGPQSEKERLEIRRL